MFKYFISSLISMICLLTLLHMIGCEKTTLEGERVDLELNDTRPILSVQVADADEASLLVQKLNLEIVRMEGLTVFFFEDTNLTQRLLSLRKTFFTR